MQCFPPQPTCALVDLIVVDLLFSIIKHSREICYLCSLVMMMAMTMNVMMKRQLLCQRFSLSRKAQPWWTHLDTEGPSLSSALSISSDFFIIINAIDVSKLILFLLVPGLDQNMGTREGGGEEDNHQSSSFFTLSIITMPTIFKSGRRADELKKQWKQLVTFEWLFFTLSRLG